MTYEGKAEEFVKYSRCSLCFDFGRYDVCHKTCNCFTQDCYYFLAGLAEGRKLGKEEQWKATEKAQNKTSSKIRELEKENAELKEYVSRTGYRIAELKHEVDELKEQIEKMKCCVNCKKERNKPEPLAVHISCTKCKNHSEWEMAD